MGSAQSQRRFIYPRLDGLLYCITPFGCNAVQVVMQEAGNAGGDIGLAKQRSRSDDMQCSTDASQSALPFGPLPRRGTGNEGAA